MASVGDQLRQARESQGLTVPEVVDQTKMKTDQVQALESGDWSIFAARVYTRGFVRNYATLLKLDPEALLNDLDVELGQAQPSATKADGDSPLRAGVIDGLMLHFSGVKWRAVIPIFLIVTMASLSHELITPATGGTLFGLWFASFWISLIALSWAHDNRH